MPRRNTVLFDYTVKIIGLATFPKNGILVWILWTNLLARFTIQDFEWYNESKSSQNKNHTNQDDNARIDRHLL